MLATRNKIRRSFQLHKSLSTSSTNKSSLEKQQIISKTLYRQILKWTARTGPNVPFDPIPPLTLIPPRIDPSALKNLSNIHLGDNNASDDDDHTNNNNNDNNDNKQHLSHLAKYLPDKSIIEANKLIIPIANAADVKNATKVIYALNKFTPESKRDLEQIKERVNLGFDVLKSLNQLTERLEVRKAKRVAHEDRDGVIFHVGQVVQHKTERWRAIVGGWNKSNDENSKVSTKTSLTNKEYNLDGNVDQSDPNDETQSVAQEVVYNVHLDEGDAAHSRVRMLGSMKATQNELEAVTDDDLKRIRNSMVNHCFDNFDLRKNEFVPNEILQFEYPKDVAPSSDAANDILEETKLMIIKHENAKVVLSGVGEIASELKRIVLDTSSCAEARNLAIVPEMEKQLNAILAGDFGENVADLIGQETTSSHKLAIKHLHMLLNVALEINTMLWKRKTAQENEDNIQFPLGSIVKHKKYGFRGVVITWDPFPKADVSKWDGLQDIEGDVNKMPFYHVIPDLQDTVEAFGQERPFRYVCQENLELCPESEKAIEVALDDEWSASDGESEFTPSDSLKFCHGEKLGDDDDIIVACLNELQAKFNELLLEVRNGLHDEKDDGKCNMRIDDLFKLLQHSECLEDAFVAEESIKEVWKAHLNQTIRWSLDVGIARLLRGDKIAALDIYNNIVDGEDPEYLEAWNKKATCHYLLGEMPGSIEAARRATEINDQHSQAYAGLGLVYSDTNQYKKAAESFRKCLSLNPWSPVSSRLTMCLDTMKRLELEEDKE